MATLKDIAKATGLSITTVSRVLNNSADEVGISKKTQAHVRKVAKDLKYFPNREARNLRLGIRPKAILFLSLFESTTYHEGFWAHPFFGELMQSIQIEVAKTGSYMAYLAVDGKKDEYLETLLDDTASAVISWGHIPKDLKHLLESKQLPVVAIEPYTESSKFRSIYVDNELAIRQAVDYLHRLGHRRISLAYLDFDNGDLNLAFWERATAFEKVVAEFGEEIEGRIEHIARKAGTTDIEAGRLLGVDILMKKEKPTAIIAVNDLTAIGIIKAAKDCGISVPGDLSVVGIDDIEWAQHHDPPLTTIRIPRQSLAKKATSTVQSLFKNPQLGGKEVRIGTKLVVRGSTSKL